MVRKETEGEDVTDVADPTPIGFVPDLVSEDSLFRRAGCGLGEKESYLVYTALKVLLGNVKEVRGNEERSIRQVLGKNIRN